MRMLHLLVVTTTLSGQQSLSTCVGIPSSCSEINTGHDICCTAQNCRSDTEHRECCGLFHPYGCRAAEPILFPMGLDIGQDREETGCHDRWHVCLSVRRGAGSGRKLSCSSCIEVLWWLVQRHHWGLEVDHCRDVHSIRTGQGVPTIFLCLSSAELCLEKPFLCTAISFV